MLRAELDIPEMDSADQVAYVHRWVLVFVTSWDALPYTFQLDVAHGQANSETGQTI